MPDYRLDPDGADSAAGGPAVRMTISLPNPDAARQLLRYLGDTLPETSFTVQCVTETGSPPCIFAVDTLTNRQRSTLGVAVEQGYYDEPKDATLSDIAAEFDCSESAVSQRLTAVERQLARSLVDARK